MSATTFSQQPEYLPVLVREVRNPLCTIMLACDLLRETGLDAEQEKYLDILNRSSLRITQQVDKILMVFAGNGETFTSD